MSKSTTNYQSTNGSFTGKTVTTNHGDGAKTVTNYKATGEGLGRTICGPSWTQTSTTKVDKGGNSSTSTKKSSWW